MNAESRNLTRRLQEMWTWIASPPRDPVDDCTDWYGGLAVDPESFSKQLIHLQSSLRPKAKTESKPVASTEIEFGSESAA